MEFTTKSLVILQYHQSTQSIPSKQAHREHGEKFVQS